MPSLSCNSVAAGKRKRVFAIVLFGMLAFGSAAPFAAAQNRVVINEFMAANSRTLLDEDGASSDWIELYNADSSAVNLNGWFLTDSTNNLTEWQIPNVTMLPNSYLVIFASGKNRTNPAAPLHTNFQLNKSGEYLGLVDPNTNIVWDFSPAFPPQQTDVSYGRDRTLPDVRGYFVGPTPGGPNSSSGAGFAPAVSFSLKSSTFIRPFQLILSLKPPALGASNVVVRFTVDGTIPTTSSAVYTNPITIFHTTQVRARSFQGGYFPGPIHSESYLELASDVLTFKADLPIIILHSIYPGTLPPESPKLFTALEMFKPCPGGGVLGSVPIFSARAGISNHGNSTAGMPKHNFNLELWDEFNEGNNVSLLGLPSNNDFVLYAPDSYDKAKIHNPLMYQLSNESGRYAPRTRFVELFASLTGDPLAMTNYFGLYVLEEKIKIDSDRVNIDRLTAQNTTPPGKSGGYLFSIDHVKGGITLNTPGLTNVPAENVNFLDPDGIVLALPQWSSQLNYITNYFDNFVTNLSSASFNDPTNGYARFIDTDSWIDYHILNSLTLSIDALRFSAFFYKPREGKITFGPIWDFDRSLGSGGGSDFNPRVWRFALHSWWGRLFEDLEFWQKWIDRWQSLRRNQLSTNHLLAIIDSMASQIQTAVARDIARWPELIPRSGTVSAEGYSYNFGSNGFPGELSFLKQWLSDRVAFIDTNFVAPPLFNQSGGPVSNSFTLIMQAAPGSTIYYTSDGSDPRLPGGAPSPSAVTYVGPIPIISNVRVVARAFDPDHQNLVGPRSDTYPSYAYPLTNSTWSGPLDAMFVVTTSPLVITEIMYHPEPPPPGSTNSAHDFEYIELKNIGSAPLDLTDIRFTNGISFSFAGSSVTRLGPGQYVLVVHNLTAFNSRYGPGWNVAGEYSGNLDNSGERLSLVGPIGEPILDFSYDATWYPITDSLGFSLVIANENAPLNTWRLKESWRPSTIQNGSPGAADPTSRNIAPVFINEVLSHPAAPDLDAVEVYNPNPAPVDLGGWFLSDSFDHPRKYRIPGGTVIPGGGYIFFTGEQFDSTPGTGNSFGFSSEGDHAFLFSGDANTNLTGYFDRVDFGAAEAGVSFGRYVTSEGKVHFTAQDPVTLGSPNAQPKVGPVVVSEIMYHPREFLIGTNFADGVNHEYVRLSNITSNAVPLFDPVCPLITWKVRGGIEFQFPTNVTIPAGGDILLVDFDPAADPAAAIVFRNQFDWRTNLLLFGPYDGRLNNEADNIELAKPGAPQPSGSVTYILVDKVEYSNITPWPTLADGTGAALRRVDLAAYGNDPINWQAAPVMRPMIIRQPQSLVVVRLPNVTNTVATNITFNVAVLGIPPISYQWLFNGTNITGATTSVYTLTNISISSEGAYKVIITDAVDLLVSDPVNLHILAAPVINQPLPSQPITLLEGDNLTYLVSIAGWPPPFFYQWRRVAMGVSTTLTNVSLNSTSCAFTLLNLQTSDSGLYRVVITNLATPLTNRPANSASTLIVLADNDRDRMPDTWENLYGLNPNDPTDANIDTDGDGLTNLQEYLAGTDPTNALSVLKLDCIRQGTVWTLSFAAVSNRSYSVQFKSQIENLNWPTLTNIAGRSTNWTAVLIDPSTNLSRYYRLVTPQEQPSER